MRSNHVPSCWPPRFAVAPVRRLLRVRHLASSASCGLLRVPQFLPGADHRFNSVPDTYLPASPAACAALDPWWPCWSRITPCHGLLRDSALGTPPRYGLRRTRHLAFRAAHRLLQVRRFLLRAVHGSLRARRLALNAGLWIAPYSDTLRPRVGSRIAPRSTLEFRTVHRLLCARRLAFRPARGLLRAPSSAPCVARGLLRAQHLEFRVYLGLLRLRLSLRPVPGLLLVRHLALCSTYGSLRTFHLVPGVGRGLLRAQHLLLRAGTFWYSFPTPRMKLFRFT